MVFPSSVSAYLDPSNWQQQASAPPPPPPHHHHSLNQNGIGNNSQAIFQQQQLDAGNYGGVGSVIGMEAAAGGGGGGGGGGAIAKPNSMAERARQAKIPQPESALKCPRCESTNTKFCYFNNYSLTQPRHFCKTCRRYWTRGGALRSVPVGGGCRRNKRSSKSRGTAARSSSSSAAAAAGGRSKSPSIKGATSAATASDHHHLGRGSSLLFPNTTHLGQLLAPHHQVPLLPPLHHLGQLADYNNNNNNNNNTIGLNFSAANPADVAGGNGNNNMHVVGQWRLQQQQFPFFANLEAQPPPPSTTAGMLYSSSINIHDRDENEINHCAVEQPKMEAENNNGHDQLLMSRNFLGSFSSAAVTAGGGDCHHDDEDDQQQQQRYYSSSWLPAASGGGGGGGGKYMNSNHPWAWSSNSTGNGGGGGGDALPGFTSLSSSTSHLL